MAFRVMIKGRGCVATIRWRSSAMALLQMNSSSTVGRYLSAHTYLSSSAVIAADAVDSADSCGDSTCGDFCLRETLTQMFAPRPTVVAVSSLQLLPTPATTSVAATALAWGAGGGVASRPTAAASSISLKGLLAATLAGTRIDVGVDTDDGRGRGGVDADDRRGRGGVDAEDRRCRGGVRDRDRVRVGVAAPLLGMQAVPKR